VLAARDAQLAELRRALDEAGRAREGAGGVDGGKEVARLRQQLREARVSARESREALRQFREGEGLEHLKQVVCKYIALDEDKAEGAFQVCAGWGGGGEGTRGEDGVAPLPAYGTGGNALSP
jgi:SOS response regulatory protein OraA/RecX